MSINGGISKKSYLYRGDSLHITVKCVKIVIAFQSKEHTRLKG